MDEWLAQIYGTGAAQDLEKTAQYHLLAKLAEEEGVDLSGLSEEELDQLAIQAGLGGEEVQDGQQLEEAPSQELLMKEAQAKFEEADFLGRVMAHSYTQELEKIAGAREMAGKAYGTAKGAVRRTGQLLAGGKKMSAGGTVGEGARVGNKRVVHSIAQGGAHRREALKSVGARAGAAGVAGFGAKKAFGKEKEASAFEKLALEQAQNILGAAEQAHAQQQAVMQRPQSPFLAQQAQAPQQSSGQPQFQQALDERALQILAENGYDTDAILNTLNGGEDDGQEMAPNGAGIQ